jgi:urease subunit gamma/beta
VHLTPTEAARMQIFVAAEVARRHRVRGVRLNAPEAIAIACDEMHLAARAGGSIDDVLTAGASAVAPEELMEGVADVIAEIRLEVLLEEGTRLVVLRGLGSGPDGFHPGEIRTAAGELTINAGLEAFQLEVTNASDHPVRVSSHFPFDRINERLVFDRDAAARSRLDIPAGDTVRWAPGQTRTVRLVRTSAEGRS